MSQEAVMEREASIDRPAPSAREMLIGRARDLAAEVAGRVDELEQLNRLPDDLVAKMVAARLPATLVAKSRGGYELDLDTVSEIIRPFAAVSPSVAWNFCFYVGTNWLASQMPPQCQDDYFGAGPAPLLAGSLVPTFKLTPVEGGYIASGRASWASGAPHASFISCSGKVAGPDGKVTVLAFFVPRDKVELVDTWQVEAMRTTGSIDVVVRDVLVPEGYTLPAERLLNGGGFGPVLYPGNPLYARPAEVMPMAYILPVFVGASRGAADLLLADTRGRTNTNTGTVAAAKASLQMNVGRLQARAQIAEDMLAALIAAVMRPDAIAYFTPERRAEIKCRAAMIVDYCRDTVTDATRAAGANAFRRQARLQMLFRDINMISVHPFFDKDSNTEAYGKALLGIAP